MSNVEIIVEQSHHIKLLYVEDDPVTRGLTEDILREFFSHIIVAVDGRDGLEKFHENDIDLILTDLSMPHMNGFDMIQKIRETSMDISIIVLSAYNESE